MSGQIFMNAGGPGEINHLGSTALLPQQLSRKTLDPVGLETGSKKSTALSNSNQRALMRA